MESGCVETNSPPGSSFYFKKEENGCFYSISGIQIGNEKGEPKKEIPTLDNIENPMENRCHLL